MVVFLPNAAETDVVGYPGWLTLFHPGLQLLQVIHVQWISAPQRHTDAMKSQSVVAADKLDTQVLKRLASAIANYEFEEALGELDRLEKLRADAE